MNSEKEDYYQTNINYNLKYFDNKIFKCVFDEEIYNKYKNNTEIFVNEIKKKLIKNLLQEISNQKSNFLRNSNNNNNLLNNIYRKDSNSSTNEKLYLLDYKNYLAYLKEFCKKYNKIFEFEENENKENENKENKENKENEIENENIKINNELNLNENLSFINRKDSLNIFRKESMNSNFDGSLFSLDISNSMVKNNNFNKNLLTNLNLNNVNSNDLNEFLKLNLTNIKNTEDSMIENSMMLEKKTSNNSINNININK